MTAMGSDFWIGYGLPAFGIAFGLAGLAAVWIAARRFDARFASVSVPEVQPRSTRSTPYRKPGKRPRRRSPDRPAVRA